MKSQIEGDGGSGGADNFSFIALTCVPFMPSTGCTSCCSERKKNMCTLSLDQKFKHSSRHCPPIVNEQQLVLRDGI